MHKHNCYDLGKLGGGEIADIQLTGNAANIRLVDKKNYGFYCAEKNYNFFGGLAMQSPYRVTVPAKGRWYIVVDMQGLNGNVITTVQVFHPDGTVTSPAQIMNQR